MMGTATTSRSLSPRLFPLATVIFWAAALLPSVLGKYTPYLDQSFFFAWTPPSETVPIPTTAQCETIHISWSRSAATGPSPVAPYFLQIFTSTFIVPFNISVGGGLQYDLPIPWVPGTQYEICMFDINGATGGCQAVYSVYPNSTVNDSPTCANLTYPDTTLGIIAKVQSGWSQYGWVPQCTDIQLQPTNGTPPYTYTIAPALHPPYVITSNDMNPVNWTVSLSWGTPFFVSVVDANGVGWANGPIHSGQGDPSCLSITSDQSGKMKTVAPVVAIGSGVGGLVLGLVVGALTAIAYFWWKRRRDDRPDTAGKVARMDVGESPHRPFYRDLPSDNTRDGLMRDTGYHIEPFTASDVGVRSSVVPAVSPDDSETVISKSGYDNISQLGDGTRSPTGRSHRGRSNPSVTIPTIPPPSSIVSDSISPRQSQAGGSQHVYVVHHDGGRAPVTVYTSEGTEVVELPPRYPAESGSPPQAEAPPASDITSNTSGSGDGSAIGPRAGVRPLPRPWEQTRQSGPTPTKVGNPTISFSS